jgi:amidase
VPTGLADGLPVGVQIVGPRFREDLVLAAAEAIEAKVQRLVPIDPR